MSCSASGEVILQAPVYIYEGDDVSLRCYSPYPAKQTIFYKNNQMIQNNDSDLLPIKSTDLTSTYRCSKQFLRTFYKTYSSDDTIINYTGKYCSIYSYLFPKVLKRNENDLPTNKKNDLYEPAYESQHTGFSSNSLP